MITPRVFSVREANELVLEIEPMISSLVAKKLKMEKMHDELLVLDLLGGEKIQDKNSMEGREYLGKSAELEALILSFEEEILKVNQFGCFLKDIERGLVDFFHVRDRELVYLCWQRGEKKINFWHSVDDKFEVRKPI